MNIFVANLNFKIQDNFLRELFENYGEVNSAKVIMDRMTVVQKVLVLLKWQMTKTDKMLSMNSMVKKFKVKL
jgi:RNA recognition motif-containing protein